MSDERVLPNETTVPLLHCVLPDETKAFWTALGFEITYEMHRPYLYLAFKWSNIDLHYGDAADGVDPAAENTGGALVFVDAVAPYHAALTAAMRQAYGKVLSKGLPRITRFRPGASRFTLIDPNGNNFVFIRRDEPRDIDYGGSKALAGLAKVLDNARILRESKNDDKAAWRALNSGLRKHGDAAPPVEQGMALAALIELSTALDEPGQVPRWGERLRALTLTAEERVRVTEEVADPALLDGWLPVT